MHRITACLIPLLLAAVAASAADDKPQLKSGRSADGNARYEAARKRCQENRGTDCQTRQGLAEWIRQERPITEEERRPAAGARRHNEACARNPRGSGC